MKHFLWTTLAGVAALASPQSCRADSFLERANAYLYQNVTTPSVQVFRRVEATIPPTNAYLYQKVTVPSIQTYRHVEATIAPTCDRALQTAVQAAIDHRLQVDLFYWWPDPELPIYFYGGVGFGCPQPVKRGEK